MTPGSGKSRNAIHVGQCVDVIQKSDQRTGRLSRGIVQEILTNSATHPHGIKVRLEDGRVGRVAATIAPGGDCHSKKKRIDPQKKPAAGHKEP